VAVDAPPHLAGNGQLQSSASRRPDVAMASRTSGASAKTSVAAARPGRRVANTAHGNSQKTFTSRTAHVTLAWPVRAIDRHDCDAPRRPVRPAAGTGAGSRLRHRRTRRPRSAISGAKPDLPGWRLTPVPRLHSRDSRSPPRP